MFNKQVVISITKAEFLQLLAEKGLAVPTNTPIRGGNADWAETIEFPIVIRWEEKGMLTGPRVQRHPHITIVDEDEIARLVRGNRIIEAIKYARAVSGMDLKDAKDFVDQNFRQ